MGAYTMRASVLGKHDGFECAAGGAEFLAYSTRTKLHNYVSKDCNNITITATIPTE